MRFRLRHVAPFAFLAAGAATSACSLDIGPSEGEKGVLSFELHSDRCAVLGCRTDTPILAGTRTDVRANGVKPTARYDARSLSPDIATVAEIYPYCAENEPSRCHLTITVTSKMPGTPKLEVLEDGKVVDATTLQFFAADRVETSV